MIIEDKTINYVDFGDIENSAIFKDLTTFYIKIPLTLSSENAVDLQTGKMRYFSDDEGVQKVFAKLIIENER